MEKFEKKFGIYGRITRKINIYVFQWLGTMAFLGGLFRLFKVEHNVGGDAYNLLINRGDVAGFFLLAIACYVVMGVYMVIETILAKRA